MFNNQRDKAKSTRIPNGNLRDFSGQQDGKYSRSGRRLVTTEQLGTIVREVRRSQGLRQYQLAAAAGVGVRFLIELERGKPTVQLAKTLAVLGALGCRLELTPPAAGLPKGV